VAPVALVAVEQELLLVLADQEEILVLLVRPEETTQHMRSIQHMAQEPEVLPEQQEMLVIRDLVFLAII
jgi:hypothetical protein